MAPPADMPTLRHLSSILALALAPFAACTDADEPGPPPVTTGTYHGYVQRGWQLPHNQAEARQLGLDLDDDGEVDNQAGSLIGALLGLGLELDTIADETFAAGDVVALHRLRADSLTDDATVEWRTFDGAPPAEAPRFDGTDRFTIASETGALAGTLSGGHATLAWGDTTITLPFFPDQSPLRIPLTDARMELDLDGDGCIGRLAGVIPAIEIDEQLLPNLGAEMIIHIARHPEHPFTRVALDVFDDDHDGNITIDEFLADGLTRGLFGRDVDTDGDGDRDAMSFGVALDCVPATF